MDNKKPSYAELEKYARTLVEQINKLYKECDKMALANTFKRLDYLMAIVTSKDTFNTDFVSDCEKEIVRIMDVSNKEEISKDEVEPKVEKQSE